MQAARLDRLRPGAAPAMPPGRAVSALQGQVSDASRSPEAAVSREALAAVRAQILLLPEGALGACLNTPTEDEQRTRSTHRRPLEAHRPDCFDESTTRMLESLTLSKDHRFTPPPRSEQPGKDSGS